LHISFDCRYTISGNGTDLVESYIQIFDEKTDPIIAYKTANLGSGDNRASNIILFPISANFATQSPLGTNFRVHIGANLRNTDDTLTINTGYWNLKITEIENGAF
jgi:hypothetical protein